MSDNDYRSMSNRELMDRLEKGELQTNPDLCAEFMRRMEEQGTSYSNTPEDIARWKSDVAASAEKIKQHNKIRIEIEYSLLERKVESLQNDVTAIRRDFEVFRREIASVKEDVQALKTEVRAGFDNIERIILRALNPR